MRHAAATLPPVRVVIGGLIVESDIEIPNPVSAPSGPGYDVLIRLGAVNGYADAVPCGDGITAVTPDGRVLLDVPDAGRFLIEDGERITVEPVSPAVRTADLLVYLLGTAFGALLMQRGIIPLHATTVRVGTRAVALCGESGAGKSTLGRALVEQGHALVADDVTPVRDIGVGGAPPLCLPLVPFIKLWEESLQAFGGADDHLGAIRPGIAKFRVPVPRTAGTEPVALSALLVLRDEGGDRPTLQELRGAGAANMVLRQFYRPYLAERLLGRESCLLAAARIAAGVRVAWLGRKKDFSGLDDLARIAAGAAGGRAAYAPPHSA